MDSVLRRSYQQWMYFAAAFALVLVPGFRRSERSQLTGPRNCAAGVTGPEAGRKTPPFGKPAGSITASSWSPRLVCWRGRARQGTVEQEKRPTTPNLLDQARRSR